MTLSPVRNTLLRRWGVTMCCGCVTGVGVLRCVTFTLRNRGVTLDYYRICSYTDCRKLFKAKALRGTWVNSKFTPGPSYCSAVHRVYANRKGLTAVIQVCAGCGKEGAPFQNGWPKCAPCIEEAERQRAAARDEQPTISVPSPIPETAISTADLAEDLKDSNLVDQPDAIRNFIRMYRQVATKNDEWRQSMEEVRQGKGLLEAAQAERDAAVKELQACRVRVRLLEQSLDNRAKRRAARTEAEIMGATPAVCSAVKTT